MKLKSIILAAALVLCVNLVFAADNGKPKSIDAVMAEIRGDLGLKAEVKVDPTKVSTNRLEELGDSVMEVMAGSHEAHELMEQRMGGEGSVWLVSMHRKLGYQYLTGMPLGWMSGMMKWFFGGQTNSRGGFMMGNWGGGVPYGMMGGFGYFGFLMGGLILLLIILAIFFIVRAAIGKNHPQETAMDILKKRYAKGEITKDDFEKMKKDL